MQGAKYTSACDVWSLGVMMQECLLGYFPYREVLRSQGAENSIDVLIEVRRRALHYVPLVVHMCTWRYVYACICTRFYEALIEVRGRALRSVSIVVYIYVNEKICTYMHIQTILWSALWGERQGLEICIARCTYVYMKRYVHTCIYKRFYEVLCEVRGRALRFVSIVVYICTWKDMYIHAHTNDFMKCSVRWEAGPWDMSIVVYIYVCIYT
jgi:hypothetical protein